MATAQTVILPYGQPFGYPGQLSAPGSQYDSQSGANKEASASMRFGCGVKPGVNVKEVLLPTANSSILAGVLLNQMVYAPGTFGNVSATGIIPNTVGEFITEGRCYVEVASDTVAGNDVRGYWCFETAGNSVIGQFRDTDDGHVVDTTKQVVFKGTPFHSADVLEGGTTMICEAYISISNKP